MKSDFWGILDYSLWKYIFQKEFLKLGSGLKLVCGAYFLHIYPMEIIVI